MKCNCLMCQLESSLRDQLDIPAPVVKVGQGEYARSWPSQPTEHVQNGTGFTISCHLQGNSTRVLKINDIPVITTDSPSEMTRYKTLVEISLTLYKAHLRKNNLLK